MDPEVGDNIRIVDTPAQTGIVSRIHVLGSREGIVVTWNAGPLYSANKKIAYFGAELMKLQLF